MLPRPSGFIVYGILGVEFFSTSDLLHPNLKTRLQLIRARPTFYMFSINPNVSLGIVGCSLHIRRVAIKHDYHTENVEMFTYTPVEFNCVETLAKPFIIPARQNQFI